jgi:hypothetical protein
MSVVEKHAPGSFCWVELGTTDAKAAKAFYSALFGWQPNDMPMGPAGVYTMLQVNGKDIGALYELDKNMLEMGVPTHWMQYIAVANADDTAARVKYLGGQVMKEPFDVFDAGRMAVMEDPTGAMFAIWQANRSIGAQIAGELNTHCWSDLSSKDRSRAQEFYTDLFGWEPRNQQDAPHQYTEIWNQGRPIGGMLQIEKDWGNVPSHWMPYFSVADCDATAVKAKESGASLIVPPTDIAKVGRFSIVKDPQGAVFAVIHLIGAQ